MIVLPTADDRTFPPVKRPSATLGLAFYDHLKALILTGAIAPGSPLKEQELAERFQISSTPIREALSRLSDIGLVEIVNNKAKRVAALDHEYALEILFTHNLLMEAAYRPALEKISTVRLGQLGFHAETMKTAFERGDTGTFMSAISRFENVLIEEAGQREISRVLESRSSYLLRHILLTCQEWFSSELVSAYFRAANAAQSRDITALLAFRHEVVRTLAAILERQGPAGANGSRGASPAAR